MVNRRLQLHRILCDILGSGNAYYQPPESIKIKYPAIIYNREDIDGTHADDKVYLSKIRYSLTVVDSDPDSDIVDKVSELPSCSFNRHYTKDNLNHDVFTIYF